MGQESKSASGLNAVVSRVRGLSLWHVIVALMVVALVGLLLFTDWYTVVDASYEPGRKYADPVKYVDERWERILSTVEEDALDLPTLLGELGNDPAVVAERCHTKTEELNNYSCIVKSEGKVIAVHTESRKGTMDVDLPPYDGRADVTVLIGPVIKLDSIRDSIDYLSYNHFENQPDWADASEEIVDRFHELVKAQIVQDLSPGADFYDVVGDLTGKTVSFRGAFTFWHTKEISEVLKDHTEIVIVLTHMEVSE
jgi:predicted lipoprotein